MTRVRYYTNHRRQVRCSGAGCPQEGCGTRYSDDLPAARPDLARKPRTLLEKYQKWSTYEPEDKTVMIAYATMYGNTENAVNVLANMLADKGVKNIAMYDVSETRYFRACCGELPLQPYRARSADLQRRRSAENEANLSDIKALALQNRTRRHHRQRHLGADGGQADACRPSTP